MAIGLVLTQIFHELLGDLYSDTIRTIIVITERNIFALTFEINRQATLVTDHTYFRITDSSQRIGNDRKTGDTCRTDTLYIPIVKRHLECLIRVFIMHIMDYLQGVHIHFRQPAHHLLILSHHLIVFQILAANRLEHRGYLYAAALIPSSVDRI